MKLTVERMTAEEGVTAERIRLCYELEHPSDTSGDWLTMENAATEIRHLAARIEVATQALRAAKAGFYLWENGHAFDGHGAAREYDNVVNAALCELDVTHPHKK